MKKRVSAILLVLMLAVGAIPGMVEGQKKGPGKLTGDQKIAHLLDRITFGIRPGDVDRVKKMGWEKYLEEQLHPERISDQALEKRLEGIESIHLSTRDLAKYYPPNQVIQQALKARGMESLLPGQRQNQTQNQNNANPNQNGRMQFDAEEVRRRRELVKALEEMGYRPPQQIVQQLQQAKILRAIYSERQFQEVLTDFWFNHFNVFIQKGADRILTTSYERDVIRPKVFGKFEDLLRATAESPAMLFYLDNWMSASPNAPAGRRNIRNQGDPGRMPFQQRQLRRNRGLNENYAREIMELHTLGVDGGYTQKDVQEVARCFTGWTIRNPRGGGEFVFNRLVHDDGEKVVLGHKIPAGGGQKDGEMVIRILARHPSTAKFISTKLARKFVSDDPPASLIARMAKTFQQTDGNLFEVYRTMIGSNEFWAHEYYRAKIKTPFEMTVSAARALDAETNGGPAFHRWISQMGEGLYLAQPPTGYPDTSEHWVNTGALLIRMNFALALSSNRIPGTRVDLDAMAPGMESKSTERLVDRYVTLLLGGNISPQTRATIDKQLSEQLIAGTGGRVTRADASKIVGLIIGSPEFQRQ